MSHESGIAGLTAWLAGLPSADGLLHISDAKRFAHDETKYDEQYGNEAADVLVGRGIVNVVREAGATLGGAALEVGCGTGLATVGLAAERVFSKVIATDPSPAFLRIAREKLKSQGLLDERIALAVMQGEDIARVPAGSLSLILLRSALHHILQPKQFLRAAAGVLAPGGILTCEEPCFEGYLLMGTMARFFPVVAKSAGEELTAEQLKKVDEFVQTMQFYTRRDVDKSGAEDKHVFRVDEIMEVGAECGLRVKFHPNVGFRYFAVPEGDRAGGKGFKAEMKRALNRKYRKVTGRYPEGVFRRFSRTYVRGCMGWDAALMEVFERCMGPYCDQVDVSTRGGRPPYLSGVFVCTRV